MARTSSVMPGFGLTLGLTVAWVSLIVLIPLGALALKSLELDAATYWATISERRVARAFMVSFGCALVAAVATVPLGGLLAWVLVRYRFPGRRFIDSVIDLPFALPTAVAGIALSTLYAETGWVGRWLPFKVSYTWVGITVALVFIGLPFVVRTVQPILEDLGSEFEEAAASLGASRWQVVRRVVAPEIWPALLTGFALSFARGVGEYGSVVFIAGNMPFKTEIVPLLIIVKLEQYQYAQATALGVAMLVASFALLLTINLLQRWLNRRQRS